MRYIDNDLDSIQEMRNLIQNAQISFLQLQNLEQNELNVYGEKFIEEIEIIQKVVCLNLQKLRELLRG